MIQSLASTRRKSKPLPRLSLNELKPPLDDFRILLFCLSDSSRMNILELLACVGKIKEGGLKMRRRVGMACGAKGDETSAKEDKDGEDEVVHLFGIVRG